VSWIRRSRWLKGAATATFAALLVLPVVPSSAAESATSRTSTLPENSGFGAFAAGPDGVSVIGTVQSGSGIAGDCDLAPLTTTPLGVGPTTLRSCSDPALWAEPVSPVQSVLVPSYDETLRVARRVNGAVSLGPVLATFQENSGSHPVFAYGAGSLWAYEAEGPNGATLFRVSLTTGRLLEAVRSPDLTRPLLLADEDGAWLVPAGSFGALNDVAIYHLGLDSTRIVPALRLAHYASGFADWAVATDHAVYADFCSRPISSSACTVYGLAGASATQIFRHPGPLNTVGSDFALSSPSEVYLLEATNPAPNSSTPFEWSLERVDLKTGATSKIAGVLLPEFWSGPNGTQQPDAIIANETLFLLSNPDSTFPDRLEEVGL
jgi:hypothetical protein